MLRADSLRRAVTAPRTRSVGLSVRLALVTLSLLAWAVPSLAQGQGQARRGLVYVDNNVGAPEGANAIIAFQRDNNTGKLSPLGSFPTRGTGVHPIAPTIPDNLGPFDSDQNIIFNPARTRLFAVNSGSDTVAVFNVQSNGRLTHVPGSPFPSGGANPVSVGLSGNILTVANKDYDLGRPGFNAALRRPNLATFRVSPQGRLTPISAVNANPDGVLVNGGLGPRNPVPTQALVSSNGRVVFDANFFGFRVNSYRLRPNGRIEIADSQPIPAGESPTAGNPFQAPIPLGLQIHPKASVLYVGFVLDQKIGVFDYNQSTGSLSFVRSVTGTGDALVGVCWLVTNSRGTRLYGANNFNNTITVLGIDDPRNPVVLQTVTLAQGVGDTASPFQIALDPSGRFLHVVTQAGTPAQDALGNLSNSLQVLRVDGNGLLTLVDGLILPTSPSRPQGVVAK
jgi:6-phosphogluconolactonase (cycloisomerase 2 family)